MPRYKTVEFADNTIPRLDVGPGKTLGPDGPAWQRSSVTINDNDGLKAVSLSLTADHGTDAITLDSDSVTPMGLRSTTFGGGSTVTFPGGVYTLAGLQLANTFTLLNTFSATTASIAVAQRIIHDGDTDTYHEFLADQQIFRCGNLEMLKLIESAIGDTEVVVNDRSSDVNFRVEGDTDGSLLVCDAGLNTVTIGGASSTGKFNVLGTLFTQGLIVQTRTVTNADYTATTADIIINFSTGATTRTLTLPALPTDGTVYLVKKVDSGVGLVTVDGNGNTIDGDATPDITAQYESWTLAFENSAWHVY